MDQKAIEMAEAIKKWWIENEVSSVMGDEDEFSSYMKEPPFVAMAKEIIGDWEKITPYKYPPVSDETKAAIERNVQIHGEDRRPMITDALCWAEKIWLQRDKNGPLDPDVLVADLVKKSKPHKG